MVCLDELIGTKLISLDFDRKNNIMDLRYENIRNRSLINKDYLYIVNDKGYTCYTDYFIKLAILTKLLLNVADRYKKRKYTTEGRYAVDKKHNTLDFYAFSLKEVNELIENYFHDYTFDLTDIFDICKTYTKADLKDAFKTAYEEPDFINTVFVKLSENDEKHRAALNKLEIEDVLRITKRNKVLVIKERRLSNANSGILDFLLSKASKDKRFFKDKIKISVDIDTEFICKKSEVLAFVSDPCSSVLNKLKEMKNSYDNYKRFSIDAINEILLSIEYFLRYRNYSVVKNIFGKTKLKYNKNNKSISFWLKRGDNTK